MHIVLYIVSLKLRFYDCLILSM